MLLFFVFFCFQDKIKFKQCHFRRIFQKSSKCVIFTAFFENVIFAVFEAQKHVIFTAFFEIKMKLFFRDSKKVKTFFFRNTFYFFENFQPYFFWCHFRSIWTAKTCHFHRIFQQKFRLCHFHRIFQKNSKHVIFAAF